MKMWPSAFSKQEQLKVISQLLPFFSHKEIQEIAGISKATFYRRLVEMKLRQATETVTHIDREQVIRALEELQAVADASNRKLAAKRGFSPSNT